ncbi:MAG: mobilization protein, partial [Gammaproteobacteria bacterium]|nr:mobilization protein [Gammaproteobacteria bacterium]
DYIIARNFGRGKDFSHLHEPELSRRLTELEVGMIDVPALHAPTMRKIDHISASFWAAANSKDDSLGPTLGLLERQRVKTWLHRSYGQFDKIHEEAAQIN